MYVDPAPPLNPLRRRWLESLESAAGGPLTPADEAVCTGMLRHMGPDNVRAAVRFASTQRMPGKTFSEALKTIGDLCDDGRSAFVIGMVTKPPAQIALEQAVSADLQDELKSFQGLAWDAAQIGPLRRAVASYLAVRFPAAPPAIIAKLSRRHVRATDQRMTIEVPEIVGELWRRRCSSR